MEVISLSLVGVVILGTALSATLDWNAYVDLRTQARASRDAIATTQNFLMLVLDAETAQRGFMLTSNRRYLAPYEHATRVLPSEANQLKGLTAPDSRAAALSARLNDLTNQKLSELRETLELYRTKGKPAALALIQTDRGQALMEEIRVAGKRLIDRETMRLEELSALALGRGRNSWLVNMGGDVVLAIMLIVASIAILRAAKRRDQLIAALRDDDVQLRQLRFQAEAAEERSRNILESIADGFISFDKDWNVTYLNPEAERIFDRPKSDLMFKNCWQQFPELAGTEFETRLREAAAVHAPVSFEIHLADRNVWWEQNIYPGKDGSLSVYFRDVTERRRFEDRARHSQKLESLGVLAGGVAHDFNNLLTAILGSASLAIEETAPGAPVREHLSNVLAASERAAQLTRQMLAYSGRGQFFVEPVDLSRQVREITALLHATLGGNIELVLKLQDDAFIEADAGQFQSVVMNLVINGAEAIGKQSAGTLVVSTCTQHLDDDYLADNLAGDNLRPGAYILLEVHDTGQGMDTATMARIFDPFFTTKFTGRGLGLAAVLGIVRGHKGAIKVYSHPGKGTTFKLFFPALPTANAYRVPAAPSTDFSGDATVLVVDDEPVVLKMAESTLRRYGYKVLVAANGREAVDLFRPCPEEIGLVLLDMTMPVLSGEETLRELRAIRPQVRVIVSSGYNEIEALRRFGDGVAGFLQKPYRAATLAEKVKLGLEDSDGAITLERS